MRPPAATLSAALMAAALMLTACGRPGSAQNALGGVGAGPAPKNATGGVQNPGTTSGNGPQGEVSPSGPGLHNAS